MNRGRLIAIAVALVAALLAAYLLRGLLRSTPAPQVGGTTAPVVVETTPMSEVLVAAKNLNIGEKLGGFSVEWRSWPRSAIAQGMINRDTQPDAITALEGARARLPIVVGEPIFDVKIVQPGDRGFMSAILPQGMRAVAIGISDRTAASGFILPNDRVDIILTRRGSGNSGGRDISSEIVLSNVRVLAINQALREPDGSPAIADGRTAVLELDPQQSEVLAKIESSGELSLALRSLAEEGDAGSKDDRPVLADSYRTGRSAVAGGPLVVRYGLERLITNR
ncbi:Flp pilus assembly protein CpaB [Aestuariivirga sp.]|jgi:pilus assembly protein CpaB|uniref:Flp pilus assembly protein CpaB n=1 Tax=Aestuariivirga sp. TaxID=2650926 RepID=UPI003784427D